MLIIKKLNYIGSNKKIYPKEKKIRSWARRSIVSVSDINVGEKFSYENIWSKRPGTGIPSYFIKNIIGKKSKKKIYKDSLIKYSDY